ncbi:MAG: transposase [Thermodesulfobacteriota bacterium]
MNYNRIARKLRQKIAKFSGEVSGGLPKATRRFISEMVYGIQASQSVVLTKIARTLEESISIKKVEERLSRQLGRRGLGSIIQRNILKLASGRIGEDTLLILDPSDIRKKYAKKMEYLSKVHDGSQQEIGSGYWFCKVMATEIRGDAMVPLAVRLYSSDAPDHVSENHEILDVIGVVSEAVNKRGIWVMDRGGDRKSLMYPLLKRSCRFLIRLIGHRHLIHGKNIGLARDIADSCPCPYRETVVKIEDGKEKVYQLDFGFRNVYLPGSTKTLGLLVVRGFGHEPMMLLTTEPLRRNRKVLWRLVEAYMRRWAIEETIRFIKQSYDVEDVRVLNYQSLQNLMPLVLAASYFASVVLDTKAKLKVMAGHVLRAAKRLFGIPDFHYYAIADGLTSIFRRYPGRVVLIPSQVSEQISMFIAEP